MAFVWDKYTVNSSYTQSYSSGQYWSINTSSGFYTAQAFSFSIETGHFVLTSPQWIRSSGVPITAGYFSYAPSYPVMYYTGSFPALFEDADTGEVRCYPYSNYGVYSSISTFAKGSIAGTVTGTTASEYPANGVSGSNWYIYRGAPSEIAYAQSAQAGQSIVVSWVAGTNALYYRLQRRLDGGEWVTLSSVLTQASYTDSDIAANTTAATVEYRVCTLGESAQTDYVAGSVCVIPRSCVHIKQNGAWQKASAAYKRAAGAWEKLSMEQEQAEFLATVKYKMLN